MPAYLIGLQQQSPSIYARKPICYRRRDERNVEMTTFTLKAKNDHLQKVASTRDYIKGISEFVWNALDADAKEISVELSRNSLGGLEGIIIRDNGTGITKKRADHDFESLGDSWKLTTTRTPILARVIHGKEGDRHSCATGLC